MEGSDEDVEVGGESSRRKSAPPAPSPDAEGPKGATARRRQRLQGPGVPQGLPGEGL